MSTHASDVIIGKSSSNMGCRAAATLSAVVTELSTLTRAFFCLEWASLACLARQLTCLRRRVPSEPEMFGGSSHIITTPPLHGRLVLLADFGLAKELPDGVERTVTICGTIQYMSPEILQTLPYVIAVSFPRYVCLLFVCLFVCCLILIRATSLYTSITTHLVVATNRRRGVVGAA
jgi:serine/threonine protein kinase